VDVTVHARVGRGFTFAGGTSTGQTVADNCDVRAHLPELATTSTGTTAFGPGLTGSAVTPLSPYCHVAYGMLTQLRGLSSYLVPGLDLELAATFQSKPGALLAANYAAPNSVVAPSLGRNLSGNAANATVNLIEPGSMYGDRINQIDLHVAKVFRLRRARSTVGPGHLQCTERKRRVDLQQHLRAGGYMAAAADGPDPAPVQDHSCARLVRRGMAEQWRRAALTAIVLLVHIGAAAVDAQADSKHVLVLYSTRPDAQLSIVGENELPRILGAGLPQPVVYYSEFMDVGDVPAARPSCAARVPAAEVRGDPVRPRRRDSERSHRVRRGLPRHAVPRHAGRVPDQRADRAAPSELDRAGARARLCRQRSRSFASCSPTFGTSSSWQRYDGG
jgi:hypothetical protein